MTKKNNILL